MRHVLSRRKQMIWESRVRSQQHIETQARRNIYAPSSIMRTAQECATLSRDPHVSKAASDARAPTLFAFKTDITLPSQTLPSIALWSSSHCLDRRRDRGSIPNTHTAHRSFARLARFYPNVPSPRSYEGVGNTVRHQLVPQWLARSPTTSNLTGTSRLPRNPSNKVCVLNMHIFLLDRSISKGRTDP